MIKAEVIAEFTLKKFNELKNIKRANESKNEKGRLYLKDIFECNQEIADYLTGNNPYNQDFIKIIEVIPEEVIEELPINQTGDEVTQNDEEVKPKKSRRKK